MPAIDLTKVLRSEHQNHWVALTPDETAVIAVGDRPQEVLEQARQKGYSEPILHWVVPFDKGYLPLG